MFACNVSRSTPVTPLSLLCRILHRAIKCQPGDVIYEAGSPGDQFYMLYSGLVQIETSEGVFVRVVEPGKSNSFPQTNLFVLTEMARQCLWAQAECTSNKAGFQAQRTRNFLLADLPGFATQLREPQLGAEPKFCANPGVYSHPGNVFGDDGVDLTPDFEARKERR